MHDVALIAHRWLDATQKGPAIYTDQEHLQRFSLAVNEIVKTPLGVTGTVCGVKYATAEQAASLTGGKVCYVLHNFCDSIET